MAKFRIIARLDVKGPNLVKGIQLEGLRALGNPEDFARYYYQQGADELFYMDVVASLYDRNSLGTFITKTAQTSFVPLAIGGGIRSVDDINRVLREGADKVAINTGAIKNPSFIKESSLHFGSSTISGVIEAIGDGKGNYKCFTDNGREETGLDAVEWSKRLQDLGVGEIVLTSVDRDGTYDGIDLRLLERVVKAVNVPVIAHGGVGSCDHVFQAYETGAEGVAIASVLHYFALASGELQRGQNSTEGNFQYFTDGSKLKKGTPLSIADIKNFLIQKNVPVRSM